MQIEQQLNQQLRQLQDKQQWRQLRLISSQVSDFASNDYLGLSRHPALLKAFSQGLQAWGCGSRASALISGYQQPHAYLRAQLAEWLQRDQVLLFASGFSANQCVMHSLADFYQGLVVDRLSHASIMDAVRHYRHWRRFRHNDVAHARQLISAHDHHLIVSEGVFSMDGDAAPVAELIKLEADLWLDDAHGLGVTGADRRGLAGSYSQSELPLLTVTFGKALGVMGAALAASDAVIDFVTNKGRDFIYSTAFPAAQACAVSQAIRLLQGPEGQQLQQRLNENIALFQQLCQLEGLPVQHSEHAIQTFIVGSETTVLEMGAALYQKGFHCGVIRPPTVPKGSSRLRITLRADHQTQEIRRFVQHLSGCWQSAISHELR